MGLMDFFKKNDLPAGVRESVFECQRDGLTIRGTEYRPEGDALPVAIVCHGFMAFQDTVRQYAKMLAGMGYAAYCFDFCGGSVVKGKSEGSTTDMSVLTEVEDLRAVIAYAQNLPHTGSELLLMGCSQGAFVSALVAARNPSLVSKLALFYPAFCIPDDARAGKMMFARFDPYNVPERISCGPMKLGRCYVTDVLDMDPFAEIAPYQGPVLIVHGTKDRIVHPDYAQRAWLTYSTRPGCPPDFVELQFIQGGAHGFSKKHDALAMQHLREFV